MQPLKRSFAPVIDNQIRLLILGSLPGDASLAQSQYYGHPQNQFWRLMADVLGIDLPAMNYQQRLATLLANHVGLWDVVAQARREGSLDSQIRDQTQNDLCALISTLPHLTSIAFNGGSAARLGLKSLKETAQRYRIIQLPSSSPAYTLAFAQKLLAWRELKIPLTAE